MIYAIVGPTGVGKTKLSIELAKRIDAEIINCDSMQVYKKLKIGVAKIKEQEKEGISHHLFDVVSVDDEFNAFLYQEMGRKVIDDLISKHKNIVVVGGTGLYLKALLYDYTFKSNDSKKRLYDFKLIALTRDRNKLYDNINKRVDEMIDEGLIEEAKGLYNKKDTKALKTAIGYKELFLYFDGILSKEDAINKIKQASRNYAKRQYTFFKHQFDDIFWYDVDTLSINEIVDDIIKK